MYSKEKFIEGYKVAESINSDMVGLVVSDMSSTEYLADMHCAIKDFAQTMNAKMGDNNPNLFGYTYELWNHGTFYIDALSKRTGESGHIPDAHPFASADFSGSWGELYQLKDYRNAYESAKAQSVTYNHEYQKYLTELAKKGRPLISKEQYLMDRNLDPNLDMNLPIYEAQTRLIPSDQLQDAIKALKIKILSEPRPEQRYRYEDTLNKLVDRIESPNGASSIPLTREDSLNLAKLAREGKFDPKQYDITLAQKADKLYLVQNTMMSGISAAVVCAAIKAAPHISKCLIDLLKEGKIEKSDFDSIGDDISNGAQEGFIRGTMLACIKNACNLGHLGNNLQELSLDSAKSVQFNSILVVIATLAIETTKDALLLNKGKIERKQFEYNLSKRFWISSFSVCGGIYAQSILPTAPILGYLIGSFVGSAIGAVCFEVKEKLFISLSIKYGITYFGLVSQDYSLPNYVLKNLGFETFETEEFHSETFETEELDLESFVPEDFSTETFDMHLIRRGLIGVRSVGYLF